MLFLFGSDFGFGLVGLVPGHPVSGTSTSGLAPVGEEAGARPRVSSRGAHGRRTGRRLPAGQPWCTWSTPKRLQISLKSWESVLQGSRDVLAPHRWEAGESFCLEVYFSTHEFSCARDQISGSRKFLPCCFSQDRLTCAGPCALVIRTTREPGGAARASHASSVSLLDFLFLGETIRF